jgi:phosphoribosylamine--glycine ligase
VLARDAEVIVTPGNPAIPGSADVDPEAVEADLFVIGPEAPLVDGLADRLRAQGKLVFGPGADGAQVEGSKAWMKDLLVEAGVPTARHGTFTEVEPALAFLATMPVPYVVKTDGLAAGKGVVVTESLQVAQQAVRDYLSGDAFGDAGRTLVIEEGLVGAEVSNALAMVAWGRTPGEWVRIRRSQRSPMRWSMTSWNVSSSPRSTPCAHGASTIAAHCLPA